MEETKVTTGIILENSPFRERDSKVEIYTKDFGKISLIARGTKSVKSKLRGYIEPFFLVRIMIVKGRKYDYLGSVAGEKAFLNLRNDYDKVLVGAKVLKLYLNHIKEKDYEMKYFDLLFEFLSFLNDSNIKNHELIYSFFILKFLDLHGLKPELYRYLDTGKKIEEKKHCFSLKEGGIIEKNQSEFCLAISVDVIKILRLALEERFEKLEKVKVNDDLFNNFNGIIKAFFDYNFKY